MQLVYAYQSPKKNYYTSFYYYNNRYTTFLRRTRAAIIIQKTVRMFVQRKKYLRTCRTVLGLQAKARGMWARQKYQHLRRNAAATVIQVIMQII